MNGEIEEFKLRKEKSKLNRKKMLLITKNILNGKLKWVSADKIPEIKLVNKKIEEINISLKALCKDNIYCYLGVENKEYNDTGGYYLILYNIKTDLIEFHNYWENILSRSTIVVPNIFYPSSLKRKTRNIIFLDEISNKKEALKITKETYLLLLNSNLENIEYLNQFENILKNYKNAIVKKYERK